MPSHPRIPSPLTLFFRRENLPVASDRLSIPGEVIYQDAEQSIVPEEVQIEGNDGENMQK